NYGCIVLDCNKVTFGNDVYIGPSVQIYTAQHPLDPVQRRNYGPESARPIVV
ncbi:hypothetical protein HK096_010350, partial [Nowakowskiella sp. JEL0078]